MDNANTGQKLTVTPAPHIQTDLDTRKTMLLVLMALLPSFIMGTYVFGLSVPVLTAVCVGSSVFFEWAYEKLLHKKITVTDLSAAVTGAILAFNLPSGLPLWMAVIGSFVAIVIVKQLFGGLGKNIANPAIVGRIVLLLSFTDQMTAWPLTRLVDQVDDAGVDAVTGATPLGEFADSGEIEELSRMFIGFIEGSAGEISTIAILIGGGFLIWKKVISPLIPAVFLGTMFAFSFVYYSFVPAGYGAFTMALFHLFAGGAFFGAFFCATDYVTSPILTRGKVVYGIGLGVITMVIRLFGSYPEGVSFAILLMNILTPLIDRVSIKTFYRNVGVNGHE